MWKKSLKARLTVYIVLPVTLALVAVGGVAFYSAYNEAQSIYDSELSHVAGLMLSLLNAEDQEESRHERHFDKDEMANPDIVELGTEFQRTGQFRKSKLAFRIWYDDKLLFYSPEARDFGPRHTAPGFSDMETGRKSWRLYVQQDEDYTLEIAQNVSIREQLIAEDMTRIFTPLALLLPIILVLVWVGLHTGLKPLLNISDAVRKRSALDLNPLPNNYSLTEVRPLIDAINALLTNLNYALQKERRFTDFAAHELRTPIAIFKTQAQTALKATDADQRRMILEAQVLAADRATALVDQLLTLSRLEHTNIPTEPLSIADMAAAAIQHRQPLADAKHIGLYLDIRSHATILGNRDLFSIILTNLIDNALKYTPPNGKVEVVLSDHCLAVYDSGPGIPEADLPFVTEQFYRVKRHQQPGSGLGLTIIKRAADIMGATLSLSNKDQMTGLKAEIRFAHPSQ